MRTEYGNPLFQHVFEMSSQNNIDWILKDLSLALRINEPRLFIHSISANKEKILDGILQINLDYEIESTNVRNNIVYPFYFAEGTKIT
jgi:phage baseplate assembly protein W